MRQHEESAWREARRFTGELSCLSPLLSLARCWLEEKEQERHWKDLDLRCLHCQRKTATSSPAGNPAQIPANKESASRNTDVSKKKGGVGGSSPRCLLRFNINNIARITATQQLNVHTSRVLVWVTPYLKPSVTRVLLPIHSPLPTVQHVASDPCSEIRNKAEIIIKIFIF